LDVTEGREAGETGSPPKPARSFFSEVGRDPGQLVIGLLTKPVTHSAVDPECMKAVEQAAKLCETLGHRVEPIELSVDPEQFFEATGTIMNVATVSRIKSRERAVGREVSENDLEPLIWSRYQNSKDITGEQLYRAQQTIKEISRTIELLQRTYDMILSPTMGKPPVELGKMSLNQPYESYARESIHASAFTMLYNATGQPAMSVPLHWSANNLPIGVMFAARFGDEAMLFRLAAQLEQAMPWFDRVPML
jgi:Asp-tRNA(Asn)/Glu-tRNA(Gln) amidotransferase A subunit family amidase